MSPDQYDALWQHQAALNERLTAAIERLTTQQAETQSLLASLDTKYQRMDVSLSYLDEALGKQTAILARLEQLQTAPGPHLAEHEQRLAQHEATMARLVAVEEQILALLRQVLRPPGNGAPPAEEAQP